MFRKPLFFALFLALASAVSAQVVHQTVLTRSVAEEPLSITYGPDGAYWFTEFSGYRVGRIDPTIFSVSEVAIPNQYSQLWGIVAGPDNNLWVTASGTSRIGRVIPNPNSSSYQDWPLPHTSAQPFAIVNGPDGTIWFVEYQINRIANFNPFAPVNSSGNIAVIHESEWIDTAADIYGLCSGPDGNLYFTEGTYGRIGQLSTNAVVLNKFQLPNTNCQPCSIVTGPDGALWFTEYNANAIGRLQVNTSSTTNWQLTEFPIPASYAYRPFGICVGNDGKIWFGEHDNSSVGNITTNGILTVFVTPTLGSAPNFLATGSAIGGRTNFDTNIWFGENYQPGISDQFIGTVNTAIALNVSGQTNIVSTNGTNLNSPLLTFSEGLFPLTITTYWGDGAADTLTISNSPAGSYTNAAGTLIASNITASNASAQTFVLYGNHPYPAMTNFVMGVTIRDIGGFFSLANIGVQFVDPPPPPPIAFFNGQDAVPNNFDYLQFPDSTVFGYYTLQYFPWVYHTQLGWEYFIDANDGQGGAYLYDNTSGHWFYTSPTLYPYLYDFTLNAWLFYNQDSSPRWFYNFSTSQWINE